MKKISDPKVILGIVMVVLSVPALFVLVWQIKNRIFYHQELLVLWFVCFAAFGIALIVTYSHKCDSTESTKKSELIDTSIEETTHTSTAGEQPISAVHTRFNSLATRQNIEDSQYKIETHRVTGMQYYLKGLRKLAIPNTDYEMSKDELIEWDMTDEKIWEYEYSTQNPQLIPEPDNAFDKNAIKVVVDGQHIGYIKKGSCSHLLRVINAGMVASISCEIGGGKYKYLTLDDDEDYSGEVKYTLNVSSSPHFVVLKVKVAKSEE